MPLINCEVNPILTSSVNCVITNSKCAGKFTITDIKLYFSVATLSTQDIGKQLQLLKTSFKRTVNWNKYQSKVSTQTQNQYLDYFIDPSFQGVYRVFVLSFIMRLE